MIFDLHGIESHFRPLFPRLLMCFRTDTGQFQYVISIFLFNNSLVRLNLLRLKKENKKWPPDEWDYRTHFPKISLRIGLILELKFHSSIKCNLLVILLSLMFSLLFEYQKELLHQWRIRRSFHGKCLLFQLVFSSHQRRMNLFPSTHLLSIRPNNKSTSHILFHSFNHYCNNFHVLFSPLDQNSKREKRKKKEHRDTFLHEETICALIMLPLSLYSSLPSCLFLISPNYSAIYFIWISPHWNLVCKEASFSIPLPFPLTSPYCLSWFPEERVDLIRCM